MAKQAARISAGRRVDRVKPKDSSPLDRATGSEVVWGQVNDLFNAARPFEKPEFIYFVSQMDGPIKIGRSKEPISRLRSMQTGNPRRLRVEYVLLGECKLEKRLHRIWEAYAIESSRSKASNAPSAPGTEWFRSEVCDLLFPVISEAVSRQLARIEEGSDVFLEDLCAVVLQAHIDHGHSIEPWREKPRILAAGG